MCVYNWMFVKIKGSKKRKRAVMWKRTSHNASRWKDGQQKRANRKLYFIECLIFWYSLSWTSYVLSDRWKMLWLLLIEHFLFDAGWIVNNRIIIHNTNIVCICKNDVYLKEANITLEHFQLWVLTKIQPKSAWTRVGKAVLLWASTSGVLLS